MWLKDQRIRLITVSSIEREREGEKGGGGGGEREGGREKVRGRERGERRKRERDSLLRSVCYICRWFLPWETNIPKRLPLQASTYHNDDSERQISDQHETVSVYQ